MDDRNTDTVTRRLHHLLARLSAQNSTSHSLQNHNPSPSTDIYNPPTAYPHTERRVWLRQTVRSSSKVPSLRSLLPDMNVKGTDDYLTARGANPRTGLISPSVVTNLTPRTPLSPAEALQLFGDAYAHAHSPDFSSKVRPKSPEKPSATLHRPRPAGPRGRWRQDSTGWTMETVSEIGSPQISSTANSSRADFHPSEDSFVIPMPTAKDPQPYRQADQDRAVQYYRDKAQRLSQKESSNRLNGRTHSIGAGPRKFAQATKALRDFSNPRQEDSNTGTVKTTTTSPTLTAFPAFTASEGSESPKSPRLSRRPVGPPPHEFERRDSGVSVPTSASAQEKEDLVGHSPPAAGGADRVRSNSNTSRFQDLRQLPRVRIVHPDDATAAKQHGSSLDKARSINRENISTPPPPYPSHQTSPSISGPSVTDSLSPLETQIIGLLAWTINHIFTPTPSVSTETPKPSSSIGILKAIHILSDSASKPIHRWQAVKALVAVVLRVVVVLGCVVAIVRVVTAVGKVLGVLLWPVGFIWVVLRWLLGFG